MYNTVEITLGFMDMLLRDPFTLLLVTIGQVQLVHVVPIQI